MNVSQHFHRPFVQHPRALTWRAECSCGTWHGHWRASPDRAQQDWTSHREGDDHGGWLESR